MGWCLLLPALALVMAQPQVVAAQCSADELCPSGTPTCVVSSNCAISSGSVFDVRPRALVLASGVRLTVESGTEPVSIAAGSVRLEMGARIALQGMSGEFGTGGSVVLEATDGIVMRPNSAIDAAGAVFGGSVTLDAGRDVVLDGVVDVSSNANTGGGGVVSVTSDRGRVTVGGGGLRANGGTKGEVGAFGGTVSIAAATDITVDAPIEAARGDCFFCAIDLVAENGTVTTTGQGTLDVRGSGGVGGGGSISISAGTAVALYGSVAGNAAGSPEGGGERGGVLDVSTRSGDVLLAAAIDLRGAEPDGDGGELSVDAALDLRVTAPVLVRTEGQGGGGSASLVAGRALSVGSTIDARGGAFGGGVIDGAAMGAVDVLGTAILTTDGRSGGAGGSTTLEGCRVDVRASALLSSLGSGGGPFAGILLKAHGTMTVAGTLRSDPGGRNVLLARSTPPAVLPSASIMPPAQLLTDPAMSCCEGCPVTTTTTSTSTSLASTTSTSIASTTTVSTTTTSSTSSTVTTTSTVVPTTSFTTTTAPPVPCEAMASWAALTCRLISLHDTLRAIPIDGLGGSRTARSLEKRLARAERQAAVASTASRAAAPLRRVAKELRRFEALVTRAERRGDMASPVADELQAASDAAEAALSSLRATVAP